MNIVGFTFVLAFVSIGWIPIALLIANNDLILTIGYLILGAVPLGMWLITLKVMIKRQNAVSSATKENY